MHSVLLLGGLALVSIQATDLIAPEKATWPQATGPYGNFNPHQTGVKLLDDLSLARQVWVSETKSLGRAKGTVGSYVPMLADTTTHPGSTGSPIVAEGKVFACSFRGNGEVWAEKHKDLIDLSKYRLSPEQLAALKRNTATIADDITVAIDAKTGKTIWEVVESGQGINRCSGKYFQFIDTPAYFQGKIFSFGTMGRIYCYNAADGTKLWQDDSSVLVKKATDLREKMLSERNILPGGEGINASLVVADPDGDGLGAVLIAPEYDGAPDVGLRGIDVQSGKSLWNLPAVKSKFAVPTVWTHQGKQYILVASIKGELRLIDPKRGTVLWTLTGLPPTYYTLTTTAKHVFLGVKPFFDGKNAKQSLVRLAAYRFSPEKVELAWESPDQVEFWFQNHMDICCMRKVVARDGKVYQIVQGHSPDGFAHIYEEETGKVLATSKNLPLGQAYITEDRLLFSPDSSHFKNIQWQFCSLDPKAFRKLGNPWNAPHDNTTGYEVFMELPYVAGFFYMRTWLGQVVCYDFRERPIAATWELSMRPASIGLETIQKPLRLFEHEPGSIDQATTYPPTSEQAGLVYANWRRQPVWEPFPCPNLPVQNRRISGTVPMDFGSIVIPINLTLEYDQSGTVSGTWTRSIPASTVEKRSGTLKGIPAQSKRICPKPGQKDQAPSVLGENPPGTTTTVLTLSGLTSDQAGRDDIICLDYDGKQVRRAAALGPYGQSWHEVDARALTTLSPDRVEGDLVLILNRDKWQVGKTTPEPGKAARIHISAERKGDELVGSWTASLGEAYTFTGQISGTRQEKPEKK